MLSAISGFLTGLSLIVAIGAQNAFVIRQSLTRQHVLLVVTICVLADASLIVAGIAGLGALISSLPMLLEVIRWFGALYLIWFGIKSLRAALQNQYLETAASKSADRKQVVAAILSFTLLNPHVYLDTVILLGSVANQFQSQRWFFGAGAVLASTIWFFGIGFGARAASRFMSRPIFWKVLDYLITFVMFSIAFLLIFHQF